MHETSRTKVEQVQGSEPDHLVIFQLTSGTIPIQNFELKKHIKNLVFFGGLVLSYKLKYTLVLQKNISTCPKPRAQKFNISRILSRIIW